MESVQWNNIEGWSGADEVSISDIRRKLEVLEWDCPLHYDASVAKRYGYEDVVAPVTMLLTWAMPAYWDPAKARSANDHVLVAETASAQLGGEGEAVVAISVDTQYCAPVCPGDRITSAAKVIRRQAKKTRLGTGVFVTVETTYIKQTGDVVGIEELTLFTYPLQGSMRAVCDDEV